MQTTFVFQTLTVCIRLATLCAIAQDFAMAHSAAKRMEMVKPLM